MHWILVYPDLQTLIKKRVEIIIQQLLKCSTSFYYAIVLLYVATSATINPIKIAIPYTII